MDDDTEALARAIDSEHGPERRPKRGVDREWAQRVEDRLTDMDATLRLIAASLGVDAHHDPTAPRPPPPEEWTPTEPEWVEPATAYEAIRAARQALDRRHHPEEVDP